MDYDYISNRNTRVSVSPSQEVLVAIPQLGTILVSPSSSKMVKRATEILHSPRQLGGIKVKVFVSQFTQMVQVIR